ncbi:HEAT repeat domain-containing protein [Chryseobacterium zhengzhouense]|uniref:HEAT repeat domain-containing protein n=1 Tax=Chryseobacterium zhengzhouense TaxID=1636086 RepID=A0ABW2LT73_9FLAO
MKDTLKEYIKNHREEFDTLEVPDETFDKIMFRLDEQNVSDKKTTPLFARKTWVAAASVAVIFSMGFYTFWNQKESEKTIVKAQGKIKTEDEDLVDILKQKNVSETAKIETAKQEIKSESFVSNNLVSSKKLNETKILVQNNNAENENDFDKTKALELLDNQYSASSRLQGIALLKDFSVSDKQVIEVLSQKALSDENTNVRLAAVETLSVHLQNPDVGKNMRQIFLQQDDAMVQKELISILANQNSSELNTEVNAKLRELTSNPTTAAFVKDEAYAVLMKY